MTPGILLITTVPWSAAERLAGAFATAGVATDAAYPIGHALAHSRHVRRHFRYNGFAPLASIRRAIVGAAPRLVIAADDQAVSFLAALFREGVAPETALLEFSFGTPSLYGRLADRNFFIAECIKAGVRAAEMVAVADDSELDAALARFGLPVVVKSDHSWGGDGVVIAQTPRAARDAYAGLAKIPSRLRSLLRMLKRRDPHFLAAALKPRRRPVGLQRHIAGTPATTSLACWKGELLAANHFEVLASQRHTGPASVLAPRDCAEMDDTAQRVVRHFGLSGLHGIDFIRAADGTTHLLEINARATPTHHLALNHASGHASSRRGDPCLALLAAAGMATASRPAATTARAIALFPQEWRRDPNSPYLHTAFHDVPWDDPAVIKSLAGPQFAAAAPLTIAGAKVAAFGA
jgi:hypothetical protein